MPFLRIDIIKGRSEQEIRLVLDTVHEAVLGAFNVPERDRYQVVNEHEPSRMIIQDTGLNIKRTDNVVFIQVFTRPRTREEKQRLYSLIANGLHERCKINPSDVIVSCAVNADDDWSFGFGQAQFVTGEL